MRIESGVLWDELVVNQRDADEQVVTFVPSVDGDVMVIDVVEDVFADRA